MKKKLKTRKNKNKNLEKGYADIIPVKIREKNKTIGKRQKM